MALESILVTPEGSDGARIDSCGTRVDSGAPRVDSGDTRVDVRVTMTFGHRVECGGFGFGS